MEKYIFFVNLKEKFKRENKWKAHEVCIKKCTEENLDQAVYFLQRDLSFYREVNNLV